MRLDVVLEEKEDKVDSWSRQSVQAEGSINGQSIGLEDLQIEGDNLLIREPDADQSSEVNPSNISKGFKAMNMKIGAQVIGSDDFVKFASHREMQSKKNPEGSIGQRHDEAEERQVPKEARVNPERPIEEEKMIVA